MFLPVLMRTYNFSLAKMVISPDCYLSPALNVVERDLRGLDLPGTLSAIFISNYTIVARYYSFMLDTCVSVRPSVIRPSVGHLSIRIWFLDDNLSKHQWIFIKLGRCIDIVEIWFGIADGQISLNFDGIFPRHIFVSG